MTDRPPIPARLTTEAQALAFIQAYRPHARLKERAAGTLGGDWVVLQDASCPRCGGSGYLSCYAHVDGGRCYDCGGAITAGAVHEIPALRYAQEGAAVERKRERERREAAERSAAAARWIAEHPQTELLQAAFANRTEGFVDELWSQLQRRGSLSDAQVAALAKVVDRRRERERIRRECPAPIGDGIQVAGTVVSIRDGAFGLQLVIRADEGWTAMGTLPAAIWAEIRRTTDATERWETDALAALVRGRRAELVATLKPSRDPALAYWSRPKQAQLGPVLRPEQEPTDEAPYPSRAIDETAHYRAS